MNKRRSILLTVLLTLAWATLAQAEVRDERRVLIGSEILGRGAFLTLNAEYFPSPRLGLGGGVLVAGGGDGGIFILPLYLSYLPGDIHSLYVSGGFSFFGGTDFGDGDSESLTVFTASLGYQYHSPGGLFVRPLFTLMIPTDDSTDLFVWPGITIGGSF